MTTTDLTPRTTILGLGRMGAAMATRLGDDLPVTSWSRREGGSPADAVRDADVVVLALYDAAACADVLDRCLDAVPDGATVVNTATVAVAEAAELAGRVAARGRRYLHAPVLGSVPAVAAGSLTVLAGGSPDDPTRAVLERLGTVVELADARGAAAAKLVANGVLADSLVTLRAALDAGDRLGLDRAALLGVLEVTPVGGLAKGKRRWLEGDDVPQTQFAVGGLVKDTGLLAAELGGRPPQLPAGLAEDDDIGALAALRGATYDDARLTVPAGLASDDALLRPLHEYALGHATGDPQHFRAAFLPTAHVEGLREGEFVSWDLETYCGLFDGPAPDEAERHRRLEELSASGTVATATMTLHHGEAMFVDAFVLLRVGDEWRIANKVYERL